MPLPCSCVRSMRLRRARASPPCSRVRQTSAFADQSAGRASEFAHVLFTRPAGGGMVPTSRAGRDDVPAAHRVRGGLMSTTEYDLTIVLEDKPGTLAKAAEAIAAERINIEGGATINCGGEGIFQALFKTEQGPCNAKRPVEKLGCQVSAQDPVVVPQA